MSFAKEMEDTYYYGIEPPLRAAGFVCERADQQSFVGDIVSWIRDRIKGSCLLVAELTMPNPNVCLEVGYAWGLDIPTVLVAKKAGIPDIPFDLKTQKFLVYETIHDLETSLK